jgi:hypothetical protein
MYFPVLIAREVECLELNVGLEQKYEVARPGIPLSFYHGSSINGLCDLCERIDGSWQPVLSLVIKAARSILAVENDPPTVHPQSRSIAEIQLDGCDSGLRESLWIRSSYCRAL